MDTSTAYLPYYCVICLSQFELNDAEASPYTLSSCGHTYCLDCLHRYLKSNIIEGNVTPECFKIIKKKKSPQSNYDSNEYKKINDIEKITNNEIIDPVLPSEHRQDNKDFGVDFKDNDDIDNVNLDEHFIFEKCGIQFCEDDVNNIISRTNDVTLESKYNRFKFFKDNKNAAECPNLECGELLLLPSFDNPDMTCSKCDTHFCFYHSNAHPNTTCEVYIASKSKETSINEEFLSKTCKPCPNCGNLITKVSGCNHMKCRCGTAFCWVCGKAVADDTFPTHFQWWNVNGCTNMQMINDASMQPPVYVIYFARIRSFFQLLIFGPITLLSALLSVALCSCCIFRKEGKRKFTEIFAGLLTFWGMFWMMVILGLPIGVILGALTIIWVIIYVVGYVIYRLFSKKYPWPDNWTVWLRETHLRGHGTSDISDANIDGITQYNTQQNRNIPYTHNNPRHSRHFVRPNSIITSSIPGNSFNQSVSSGSESVTHIAEAPTNIPFAISSHIININNTDKDNAHDIDQNDSHVQFTDDMITDALAAATAFHTHESDVISLASDTTNNDANNESIRIEIAEDI